MTLPRLVVAAPSTGQGKTTIATGLMAALRSAGHEVSGHKVGPDYIDPGYHALATARPGRNLDPHLVGEERIVPLLLHGARGADVAVVEPRDQDVVGRPSQHPRVRRGQRAEEAGAHGGDEEHPRLTPDRPPQDPDALARRTSCPARAHSTPQPGLLRTYSRELCLAALSRAGS